jgi:hypothetical protein
MPIQWVGLMQPPPSQPDSTQDTSGKRGSATHVPTAASGSRSKCPIRYLATLRSCDGNRARSVLPVRLRLEPLGFGPGHRRPRRCPAWLPPLLGARSQGEPLPQIRRASLRISEAPRSGIRPSAGMRARLAVPGQDSTSEGGDSVGSGRRLRRRPN